MAQLTLGGNPVHTIGDLPQIGVPAPSFSFIGTDMQEFASTHYAGKKIILNIFPSVDTGVCASSVREFNKRASSLENCVVLCVSKDLPFAQQRFCGAEDIDNVVMGSEFQSNEFGSGYGVTLTDSAFKGLYARAIVVIGEDGLVKYTELVPEIGQEPNYEAAIAAL